MDCSIEFLPRVIEGRGVYFSTSMYVCKIFDLETEDGEKQKA